jgi:DNA-directed RNA polymerase specialized sigma24 family protein
MVVINWGPDLRFWAHGCVFHNEGRGCAMVALNNEINTQNSSNHRDAIWRAIVDTLGGFSKLQRKVFVLYHYAGSSVSTIAEKTGLSEERILAIIDQTNRQLMHRLQRFRDENEGTGTINITGARLAAC